MIRFIVMALGALGLVGFSPTYAQKLELVAAATTQESYGACSSKIAELTEYGGIVSRVSGAIPNIWSSMQERRGAIVYVHEYGMAGPHLPKNEEELEKYVVLAKTGTMWFVVGHRSALATVKSGQQSLVIVEDEPVDPQHTVWFSAFLFPNEEGRCEGFFQDEGVFNHDLPRNMWGMLVNSALLHNGGAEE